MRTEGQSQHPPQKLHLQRVEITILNSCSFVVEIEDNNLHVSHNAAASLRSHNRRIDAAPPTKYRSRVGFQEAQESS